MEAVVRTLGRSAEVGARTLIVGIQADPESHGEYMSDSQICRLVPSMRKCERYEREMLTRVH